MRSSTWGVGSPRHKTAVVALLTVGALVAGCSSSAGATTAPASASAAAPAAASTAPASTAPVASAAASAAPAASVAAGAGATASFAPPNLSGKTIRIAIGAAPQASDTKVALMAQILQSWGANSSVVNQTGDPAAVRVILAGDAEVGAIAVTTAINSGLTIFGPAQPRLDYDFMGAPDLKTIQQLPGHVYGTSNTHGLEALMFADLLHKYNINPSSVKVTLAGGASVRVTAMLEHHIDATFVHFDSVATLTKAGFNVLAVMPVVAPELSDSFLGASPAWVKAHPDLATAVDEAWIEAALIFNNDKNQWVAAAVKYAGGTAADAATLYDQLKQGDTFPATKNAFSAASAATQETLAAQVGAITSTPAPSTWLDETPWDQAAAAFNLP